METRTIRVQHGSKTAEVRATIEDFIRDDGKQYSVATADTVRYLVVDRDYYGPIWGAETVGMTLREFVTAHSLSPETGELGLDHYEPDATRYSEARKIGDDDLYVFAHEETSARCGLLSTGTTSVMLGEDDLIEMLNA